MPTPAPGIASHRAHHPPTGRTVEVHSTQPGLQFYTGNNLDGSLKAKGAATYPKHSAFCLETQHWPDAVNQVSGSGLGAFGVCSLSLGKAVGTGMCPPSPLWCHCDQHVLPLCSLTSPAPC